ncbi:class II aldolase/adducin family protein, partial [Streptomyces sp. NPDC052207]|uniref:class II aldolase/adducin family protein n=1 Tax=Streptomyces sp. NPDC052207 TaxID=3155418 RepID=UPI0034205550
VHAARPDVVAVAHCHSVHGRALAALGDLLDPSSIDISSEPIGQDSAESSGHRGCGRSALPAETGPGGPSPPAPERRNRQAVRCVLPRSSGGDRRQSAPPGWPPRCRCRGRRCSAPRHARSPRARPTHRAALRAG